MKLPTVCFAWLVLLACSARAADYRIEVLEEGPPTDEIAADVAAHIAGSGFRVIRGTSTTYCDVWLCKAWDVPADFAASEEVLYPFRPGQLIGVARFARKGADFRDQDVASGVYTMRYGQQPVDGAHVGTSPTRDFLLLVRADADDQATVTDPEELNALSAEAAESTHPCLLAMQRRAPDAKYPAMRHNDEFDWWIVGLTGRTKSAADKPLNIEFVVVGQAIE